MDQVVDMVVQRTGIPRDAAVKAVDVVIGYLKDRLPPPVASQLDNVLGAQGTGGMTGQAQQGAGGFMDQAKDTLGGMFGGGQKP